MHVRPTAALSLGIMLAGCGGGNGSTAPGGGSASAAAWNAADGCALFGKDKVAQVMGSAVSTAELASTNSDAANGFTFSTCTYTLTDGRILSFSPHYRTDAAFTPAEIDSTKKGLAALVPQTFEDVGGLSGTAYWATPMRQLNVYPDEHRWAIFTMSFAGTGPMHRDGNDADLKGKAIALAKAAGL